MGFAGLKFSESIKIVGNFKLINIINIIIGRIKLMSLIVKNGLNGIFSICGLLPNGFLDPFECRTIRWITDITKIIIGIMKWNEKNRLRVGSLTEKFPQIQLTAKFPMCGIVEIRLVITVAAQKDICPHGKTYPKKAVIMLIINSKIPVIHIVVFFGDLFSSERLIWRKMNIKNIEAELEWIILIKNILLIFRENRKYKLNAIEEEG